MSDYIGIARRLRVTSESLRCLFDGRADIEVARAAGVGTDTLQRFLEGSPDIDMARALGLSSSDLRSLVKGIGRQGAAAFVLGLALGRR